MGVQNTQTNLHNMLMEQMERLMSADSKSLANEIARSKAVADISGEIIANGKLALEVGKTVLDAKGYRKENLELPEFLHKEE